MRTAHAVGFFIAGTLLMVFLYRYELLLFLLMGASSLLCLAVDRWKNTKMFLTAMLIGGACENLAVMLGAWNYANAGFFYAPIWLPVGWGMSVVLLEEAFAKDAHLPAFSKRAFLMAFGGTLMIGLSFSSELGVLFAFSFVTIALYIIGFYDRSEFKAGFIAALFGTAMESACIIAGSWHYNSAMFGTPLWLPLCWFNAFLIMRRIVRV